MIIRLAVPSYKLYTDQCRPNTLVLFKKAMELDLATEQTSGFGESERPTLYALTLLLINSLCDLECVEQERDYISKDMSSTTFRYNNLCFLTGFVLIRSICIVNGI